jgi:hypothetical protein
MKRAEFQGRSDKYSPPLAMATVDLKLQKVLTGTEPLDVSGAVLGDRYVQDAISRLANYRRLLNYYEGRHFQIEYDGGHKKTPWNYCRQVVDKRAQWVAGRGFNFVTEKGNELVGEFMNRVWDANQKRHLIRRTAKTALMLGDAFWYFTVKTKDRLGKDLPRDQWSVRIHPINPAYVFPLWTEDDPTEMKACMLQFPMWGNAEKRTVIFTAFYTHDTVQFYIDYTLQKTMKNTLGMIPIVHIPGTTAGDHVFGHSCLEDIIPLNDAYNETAGSIAKILKYHGEPTTIVFGAKLSQMERGSNKVWSNLPENAKVINLEMKGDLSAAETHLQRLETQIYRHGKTPKVSFDSEGLAISNTSGIAMQLMFQPLVEATLEGQDAFEIAIRKGNEIIAAIHDIEFNEDLSVFADQEHSFLDMDVNWESLLPKDEQAEIEMAEKKIAMGIWSKAEAQRRLAKVRDSEKLCLELAADTRYEIAVAAEKARAMKLGTNPPNFSVAMLSSPFLSEDLLDIAGQLGQDAHREPSPSDNSDDGGPSA